MKDGLTAHVIEQSPEILLKDLGKIKSNVELYRLLKAKEDERNVTIKHALADPDFKYGVWLSKFKPE